MTTRSDLLRKPRCTAPHQYHAGIEGLVHRNAPRWGRLEHNQPRGEGNMDLARIVLWLFVINLGIVFGAGLYEARIVVPLWASSPPESLRSPDSGRRFWAFVTTIPLTLLTLASLVAAWHAPAPRRESWLVAAVVILVERIATFSYFIPTDRKSTRLNSSHGYISYAVF